MASGADNPVILQYSDDPQDGYFEVTASYRFLGRTLKIYSCETGVPFDESNPNLDPSKVIITNKNAPDKKPVFYFNHDSSVAYDGGTLEVTGVTFDECASSGAVVSGEDNAEISAKFKYCDFVECGSSNSNGGVFSFGKPRIVFESDHCVYYNCYTVSPSSTSGRGGIFYLAGKNFGTVNISFTHNDFIYPHSLFGAAAYILFADNLTINDNIVYGVENPQGSVFRLRNIPETFVGLNNCFYDFNVNEVPKTILQDGSVISAFIDSNNVLGDPKFNDVDNMDLTLGLGSSCIGTASDGTYIGARSGGTLPVELSSFSLTQSGEDVLVKWVTQTESDLRGFYVIKNTVDDLESATEVSELIAATNSASSQEYVYEYTGVNPDNCYFYWIEAVSLNGVFETVTSSQSILLADETHPTEPVPEAELTVGIVDVYPNPFNPPVNISFFIDEKTVEENAEIGLEIYNVKGQKVHTRDLGKQNEGLHTISWNGNDEDGKECGSGIYFVKFTAGSHHSFQKSIKLK
ncbi:MAG: hypothetical protein CSB55_00610 [Candidatus Cloacimonadota bacterium]|nr:MAG: hypothetical protein CSB55_00610 [Candidatus Cloacimonadota bacterium]